MKSDLLLFLIAFAAAFATALLVIPLLRRLKAGQNILKYVDMHTAKSGTPTMGGIIFILPACLSGFFLSPDTPLCLMILATSLAYAVIGFLDDLLKIKGKQNLGLRAYQKIIAQGGVAILVSWFYCRANPSGEIFVPFFNIFINLGGVGIFILCFLIFVATTNAVNLTDGIDGLAGSVSCIYFIFMYTIIALMDRAEEIAVMGHTIAIITGSIIAYLLFNTKKASVFMGDTGSLFLGGMIAAVSVFSGMGLMILVLGVCFVWSALSVIIQVTYFKITRGKRVFAMTPFHHHLEKHGFAEPKIVWAYVTVTVLMGVISVLTLI